MPDTAAAQLYSAIPPELRAILVQQLLNSGVAAVSWGWRRWWYALRRINRQDVLYRQHLKQFVSHFSTIATPTRLVPFTGSLDVDRFLLWPELDEEIRSRTAEHAEPDREPSLPQKLKATELLTHPLSNNRLFVVEGEAGVGKTTMARALAHLAAKKALELVERKDEDGPQVQYLPLYFNAEDLIKLAGDTPVGQINPSGEGALKELLNAILQKPNRALLVIVDGLDEVGESVQAKALQRLRSLWIEEGNHRYLVLGRPGSVRDIPWIQGDEEVLKLALRPWSETEVREFLERWAGEAKELLLNEDEVDGLVGYIRDHVGLPTPALMVQMVVARYLELRESVPDDVLAQMPETRSKLYQNYLRQLLQHSEDAKPGTIHGGTAQTADRQKRLWLGCLELLLKQRPDLRQRVRNTCSVSDLPDVSREAVLDRSCGDLVGDSTEAERWWEERKLCRLGHESLHEFLAAEALAGLYRGDLQGFWKEWLLPKGFDPFWREAIIYTASMLPTKDRQAIIKGLLSLDRCDPASAKTGRHIAAAIFILHFSGGLPEEEVEHAVERGWSIAAEMLISAHSLGQPLPARSSEHLYKYAKAVPGLSGPLKLRLLDALKHGDPAVVARAAMEVAKYYGETEVAIKALRRVTGNPLHDPWVRAEAAWVLRDIGDNVGREYALTALNGMLRDEDIRAGIRYKALWGIKRLQPDYNVPEDPLHNLSRELGLAPDDLIKKVDSEPEPQLGPGQVPTIYPHVAYDETADDISRPHPDCFAYNVSSKRPE